MEKVELAISADERKPMHLQTLVETCYTKQIEAMRDQFEPEVDAPITPQWRIEPIRQESFLKWLSQTTVVEFRPLNEHGLPQT